MPETQTPEIMGMDYSKESIKLIKNTKGYNWEIKINPKGEQMSTEDLTRLDQLNTWMMKKYGAGYEA